MAASGESSLSREECFLATRTRHAFTIDGQMGVNRDGTLKGYSLDVCLTPALMHLTGTPSLLQGGIKSLTFILVVPTLTVQRPAIPTSPRLVRCVVMARHKFVFAVESMLDDAATALGIDPVEIRLLNAAREGDANPLTGKRIYSAGLPECLEKGRKILNGKNAVQNARTSKAICAAALASPV
ncbi:molybdopterin cofactor-binding domain-containing protein [Escherichia coli]